MLMADCKFLSMNHTFHILLCYDVFIPPKNALFFTEFIVVFYHTDIKISGINWEMWKFVLEFCMVWTTGATVPFVMFCKCDKVNLMCRLCPRASVSMFTAHIQHLTDVFNQSLMRCDSLIRVLMFQWMTAVVFIPSLDAVQGSISAALQRVLRAWRARNQGVKLRLDSQPHHTNNFCFLAFRKQS